jgi:hypothetical protein
MKILFLVDIPAIFLSKKLPLDRRGSRENRRGSSDPTIDEKFLIFAFEIAARSCL